MKIGGNGWWSSPPSWDEKDEDDKKNNNNVNEKVRWNPKDKEEDEEGENRRGPDNSGERNNLFRGLGDRMQTNFRRLGVSRGGSDRGSGGGGGNGFRSRLRGFFSGIGNGARERLNGFVSRIRGNGNGGGGGNGRRLTPDDIGRPTNFIDLGLGGLDASNRGGVSNGGHLRGDGNNDVYFDPQTGNGKGGDGPPKPRRTFDTERHGFVSGGNNGGQTANAAGAGAPPPPGGGRGPNLPADGSGHPVPVGIAPDIQELLRNPTENNMRKLAIVVSKDLWESNWTSSPLNVNPVPGDGRDFSVRGTNILLRTNLTGPEEHFYQFLHELEGWFSSEGDSNFLPNELRHLEQPHLRSIYGNRDALRRVLPFPLATEGLYGDDNRGFVAVLDPNLTPSFDGRGFDVSSTRDPIVVGLGSSRPRYEELREHYQGMPPVEAFFRSFPRVGFGEEDPIHIVSGDRPRGPFGRNDPVHVLSERFAHLTQGQRHSLEGGLNGVFQALELLPISGAGLRARLHIPSLIDGQNAMPEVRLEGFRHVVFEVESRHQGGRLSDNTYFGPRNDNVHAANVLRSIR